VVYANAGPPQDFEGGVVNGLTLVAAEEGKMWCCERFVWHSGPFFGTEFAESTEIN
jgi:hypothetical protein